MNVLRLLGLWPHLPDFTKQVSESSAATRAVIEDVKRAQAVVDELVAEKESYRRDARRRAP